MQERQWRRGDRSREPRDEAIDRRAIEIMERCRCNWVEAWARARAEQRLIDGQGDVDLEQRAPAQHRIRHPGRMTLSEQIGRAMPSPPGTAVPGRTTLAAALPAAVMRSAEHAEIDPEAAEFVARARRGGVPLDDVLQRQLEATLGTRLDDVRVHTDAEADAAARAIGARAFAVGDDVFFRKGAYDPQQRDGQRLIAHEVAHTVQARGAAAPSDGTTTVSQPGDAPERQADAFADAFMHGTGIRSIDSTTSHAASAEHGRPDDPLVSPAPTMMIQRTPDSVDEVHAVKSKEIEHAEAQETTDWPGVTARQKNRQKDIEYHLNTKLDTDVRAALERLHTRWDTTVVVQPDFDPVSGVLDDKALRQLIAADRADAAKLKAKRFASVVEWTKKLATALTAFLDLRQRIEQERTEFKRFDDNFLDKDVVAALATVPGNFRPADLKAMLAQETGDFTDTNIAGLEGKSKGITNKLSPNPSFVGIGQINDGADTDARAMAKKLGITLPAKAAGKADPRKNPATGIKLAANYLAYIGAQLDKGLPAGRPAGAAMRQLVLAAYNGGPFGLIAAAKEAASTTPYAWEVISKNKKAMSHFQKPGEVKDYVKRVTERAP